MSDEGSCLQINYFPFRETSSYKSYLIPFSSTVVNNSKTQDNSDFIPLSQLFSYVSSLLHFVRKSCKLFYKISTFLRYRKQIINNDKMESIIRSSFIIPYVYTFSK